MAERTVVVAASQAVGVGSKAAGPSSLSTWKERRASLRAIVSDARVWAESARPQCEVVGVVGAAGSAG